MTKKLKSIIALIPARGGSKRFPGKNLYPLLGKPLISYPIQAAKKSDLIDRIIVSTDDKKIAETAKKYGAEVPFLRPKKISRDKSPVIEAAVFTIKKLQEDEGYTPDYIALLQATTPLINPAHIDDAIKTAIKNRADSVVTVSGLETTSHPYSIRKIERGGTINFWKNDEHYKYLSKKRPVFYKAANMWLTSRETILRNNKLEGKKNYPIIVDSRFAFDVDYKEDLKLLEVYLNHGKK